ncbi:MAG TPA: response regulator [Polyangiaceae bacterium]|jgi:two-component system cell cycle response regulator CpdR
MSDADAGPRRASGTSRRIARVLVIDDETLIGELLRQALSDEFEVTATTDPIEALGWLTWGDWYDVIFCDVMMPTMNGLELRDRVADVRPDLAIRIVFVTGGIVLEHLRRRMAEVPNTVLEKPFDFASLREMIRRRTSSRPPPRRTARV